MIGIIDYGLGNINAFLNIYKRLHIEAKALHSEEDFEGVTKLILPGVGAFDHAMQSFNSSGMRDISEDYVLQKGIPVIGICVGMQMLARSSDEGKLMGLGWIDGQVRKFDETKIKFTTRLPHMGWNDVDVDKDSLIFKGFTNYTKFYFLHSYYMECNDLKQSIAESEYGIRFTCGVNAKNIYGVQFHPEKSHDFGVNLLENFSKI
jgi:glutamine amidotransferase